MPTYPTSTRVARAAVDRSLTSKFGGGVKYPIQRSETGGLATVEGVDHVSQSIIHLITTLPNEGVRAFYQRNGVPYGTRIRLYLFESVTQLKALADFEIRRAVAVWEPRAEILEVTVQAPENQYTDDGRRTVRIVPTYRIRATGEMNEAVAVLNMGVR